MKLLILLQSLFILTSADKRCHGLYFNDKYYDVNIIKDGLNNLQNLVYNKHDNTIYFTFDQISKTPDRTLGYLKLDTSTANVINGIRNATALAIDQYYGKIYVGGSDGLFKINERKIPERLPVQDDIINMHYNNGLYFTNRRKQAYKFEDGYAERMPELRGQEVDNLMLDNDNNIFFLQGKTLFRVKRGTRIINIHEKHEVSAIATDIHARAYVCSQKGVYVYNPYKFVLDKVAALSKLKAISFNVDNEPIYAVSDLIVKLTSNPLPCFED